MMRSDPTKCSETPDLSLLDYNQWPPPVGAMVKLDRVFAGRHATMPVYLQSEVVGVGEMCPLGTNVTKCYCPEVDAANHGGDCGLT